MITTEQKIAWLAALRSGNYKRGRATLKKQDRNGVVRHCCLGVLAEVVGCDWVEDPKRSGHTAITYAPVGIAARPFNPTLDRADTANVSVGTISYDLLDGTTQGKLAEVNDSQDNFGDAYPDEIIAMIEELETE